MPLPALHSLHLGATTMLVFVVIALLFLALQGTVLRRVVRAILSSAPAQPVRKAPPTGQAVRSAPATVFGLAPAAAELEDPAPAPSLPPPP